MKAIKLLRAAALLALSLSCINRQGAAQQEIQGRKVLIALQAGLKLADAREPLLIQVLYDNKYTPTYSIMPSYHRQRNELPLKEPWEVLITMGATKEEQLKVKSVRKVPATAKISVDGNYSKAVLKALAYLDGSGELELPVLVRTTKDGKGYGVGVFRVPLTPDGVKFIDVSADFKVVKKWGYGG